MMHRIEPLLEAHRFLGVVVLGGTNDLAYDVQTEQITGNLKYIYEKVVGSGAFLSVCTIPQTKPVSDKLRASRTAVNTFIAYGD